jgi:hypothetical protein
MIPLVPPAADAVAAVAVPVPQVAGFVMSKDMIHPVFVRQPIGAAVWPLATTLTKTLSVAPFMNSVTGEHSALAVAICGPCTGVPSAPAVTGICQTVVAVVAPTKELLHTYRFPVPLVELK